MVIIAMFRAGPGCAVAFTVVLIVIVIVSPGRTVPIVTVTIRPLTLTVPRLAVACTKSKPSGSVSVATTSSAAASPIFVTVRVKVTRSPICADGRSAVLVIAMSGRPLSGWRVGAGVVVGGTGIAVGGTGVKVGITGVKVGDTPGSGVFVATGVLVGGVVAVGVGGSAVGVTARSGAAYTEVDRLGMNALPISTTPTRTMTQDKIRDCIQAPFTGAVLPFPPPAQPPARNQR